MTRRGRVAGIVFLVAGSIGIVVALIDARDSAQDLALPGLGPLLAAAGLAAVGLGLLGWAWAVAMDAVDAPAPALRAFFLSQLGKYVPGGIWQPVGQVGFTPSGELGTGGAVARFGGFVLTMIAGASLVAAAVAPFSHLDATWTLVCVFTAGSVVVLAPPVTRWIASAVARVIRRPVGPLLQSHTVVVQLAWCAAGLGIYSLGFAVVLRSVDGRTDVTTAVAAFALAWLAGFIAFPVPAGIGIREAVLVAALSGMVDQATVLTASIAYRLSGIVAEIVLVVGSAAVVRALRRRGSVETDLAGR